MNDIKKIKEICIIGSGTYGSYIAKKFDKKNVKITIIDVGDSNIKSEKEIGYLSKILSLKYEGLSKGRFFGFGGSSSKWGGQLLFFSDKDFSKPSNFLRSIVDLNNKHKKNVLNNFGINDYREDENFDQELFIKHGIWLNYFKRNLFKYFKIKKQKNVTIISNSRVLELVTNDNKNINKIIYHSNGIKKTLVADYYYLTCGAFESARLLSNLGLLQKEHIKFSDHFSKRFVKIFGNPKIRNADLTFNFSQDFSLRTTRFVGELKEKNLSYFIHPIYNSDFHFFQNLKSLLFKKTFNFKYVTSILKDLPAVMSFILNIIFYKKLYIKNQTWYFQIDIEGHDEDSEFMLSKELDKFNQNGIDVNVTSVKNLESSFIEIQNKIIKLLKQENIKFEICSNDIETDKIEDTYHPYKIISNFDSIDSYFNFFENMLVVNTGILPRVGGINPTASLFPIIEQHIIDNFE